ACGQGSGNGNANTTSSAANTPPPIVKSPSPPPNPPPPTPTPPPVPAGTARYFVYVANFGDGTVSAYTALTSGHLQSNGGVNVGAGAVSIAIMPSGKFAYVANANGDSLSAFMVDSATGALTAIGGSPFAKGTTPFNVLVHPSGQFVYVANRASNDVSAFSIDPDSGVLTRLANSPFAAG